MKTLKPVKEAPGNKRYVRHEKIYNEIDTLKKGEWLPIECDTARQARILRTTIIGRYGKRSIHLQTSVTERILYVRVAQ